MRISDLNFQSRRSPVIGRNGMVSASQPLAVAAGLKILAQGGNAADAAVATAAALNVCEPGNTGLGGDAFALYYDAKSREVSALNGSGRAPAALSLERLRREGFGQQLPPYHPYTITVPGACAAWCDLIERFGRLPLSKILGPAVDLAQEGFPVAPFTALYWQHAVEQQLNKAVNGLEMSIEGRGPRPGEIFRNPGLAQALTLIAFEGKDSYYQGPIGRAIVEVVREAGGCLSEADLARHQSNWVEPTSTTFQGLRFWECPPNGQGIAALMALNILEGFDLGAAAPLSAQRLHLAIEAMRLAFADARQFVADPDFNPAPLRELLSKEYAAERRKLIDPRRANPALRHGTPLGASDTVYFCTADAEGNACSFINSNYMGFGTGIVPRGWGFSLQNRGHNFSLREGHPNQLEPGKRPYHTIIPGMITDASSGALWGPYGVMGGFMQPQGHLQVALALAQDECDPQTALDRPRFCIEPDAADSQVAIEEGISSEVIQDLAARGHAVRLVQGHQRTLFGRGAVIHRDPQSGALWGGADPRGDGTVMTGI
jgi:gamma-glutamyltranspeptidase / glutathione hydrolase